MCGLVSGSLIWFQLSSLCSHACNVSLYSRFMDCQAPEVTFLSMILSAFFLILIIVLWADINNFMVCWYGLHSVYMLLLYRLQFLLCLSSLSKNMVWHLSISWCFLLFLLPKSKSLFCRCLYLWFGLPCHHLLLRSPWLCVSCKQVHKWSYA